MLHNSGRVTDRSQSCLNAIEFALTQACRGLTYRWPELKPHQAQAYLNALLRRVIVESARIVIEIDGERALATLLAGPDVVSIKRSRQDAQPVLLQGSVVEGGGLPTKGRLRSSVQLHQRASVRYVACLIHV